MTIPRGGPDPTNEAWLEHYARVSRRHRGRHKRWRPRGARRRRRRVWVAAAIGLAAAVFMIALIAG